MSVEGEFLASVIDCEEAEKQSPIRVTWIGSNGKVIRTGLVGQRPSPPTPRKSLLARVFRR